MIEDNGGVVDRPPGPPAAFLEELAAAFRRLRPQGTVDWNFADAFGRLEKVLERLDSASSAPAGPPAQAVRPAPAAPADPGLSRRRRLPAERNPLTWADQWIGARAAAAAEEATRRAMVDGEIREAVAAAVEALRFLAARVERMEAAAARQDGPVDGLAWLVDPPELGRWVPAAVSWLGPTPGPGSGSGPVVVGECGTGELALALAAAGLAVRGAEPRGSVAWQAAEAGVDVHVGSVAELLGQLPAGALGGLVLAGVVDRVPLHEQLDLLALATDRLAPGGRLLLVGTRPEAVAEGWGPVARDLLPGRPLHPDTWQLLLERSGYADVDGLEGTGDTTGSTCAVRAVRGVR